jgi:hypothetical protein
MSMKKSRLGLLALALITASIVSCATWPGERISDYRDLKGGGKALIVLRNGIAPGEDTAMDTSISICDAYNVFSEFSVKRAEDQEPLVYKVEPGVYRVQIIRSLKNTLFGKLSVVYITPYQAKFSFEVNPGQIVYLGDFLFSENEDQGLVYSYNLDKAKSDLALIEPDIEGYEWISIERTYPDWADDL